MVLFLCFFFIAWNQSPGVNLAQRKLGNVVHEVQYTRRKYMLSFTQSPPYLQDVPLVSYFVLG